MVAIVVGTLAYCRGSVLCRALVRAHAALHPSGLATLIGGPLEALGSPLMLDAAWPALTGADAGKAGAPSSRRSGCAAAPPRGCR